MLEEQVRQSQKMEAIGRFAGGIAHDFNNILTIILGSAEFALSEAPAGQTTLLEQLETIVEAARRAAGLTGQLLAFSRKQIIEPRLVQLNDIVSGMQNMLRCLIGDEVLLGVQLAEDAWPVKADAGQIEQVLMNLAANARDAMPRGGILQITTCNVALDAEFVSLHPEMRAGDYVLLTVDDTGCGIPPELLYQIFEPFFTTKRVGEGTGMGLATVFAIVRQCDGYLSVDSRVGEGSQFNIYLPRAKDTWLAPIAAPAATGAPCETETVLLVEDEAAVRHLARQFLIHAGYQVLEADSGAAALQLAGSYPSPIHLLISDVVMPGMSGQEVAGLVTAMHPQMKVLYMSGYTSGMIALPGTQDPPAGFLQKPFTRESLAQRVRQLLES